MIDIEFNMLTNSLGYLNSVEQLNFAENWLYGQVLEVIRQLRNIEFYFCLIIILLNRNNYIGN